MTELGGPMTPKAVPCPVSPGLASGLECRSPSIRTCCGMAAATRRRTPATTPAPYRLGSLSRDNLDENGGGNQSLKAAAGSEVMIALGPAVRKHFFSVPLFVCRGCVNQNWFLCLSRWSVADRGHACVRGQCGVGSSRHSSRR